LIKMKSNILFPNHRYWHYSVPNAQQLTEYIESWNPNVKNTSAWASLCEVNTLYYSDHFPESLNKFADLLSPTMQMLCEDFGGVKIKISIEHCWLNYYSKHGFQEPHDHTDCNFVAVYFMNDGENFGDFYFWDVNKSAISNQTFWKNLFSYHNTVMPKPKAGDIIFFPSYVFHGCTAHKSDVPRKSFAFNFNINLVA